MRFNPMRSIAIILALLGVGAPVVKPWPNDQVEGIIRVEREELILFGEGHKALVIEKAVDGYTLSVPLYFARDADYKEAERLTGSLVRIEGCKVRRGNEAWFVVTGLRERR